ncbi:peroxisome proliferator-activated receptor gamma coactivator-related protein 1 isoform X1 [Osmerus eperlanus]|uniref:peroxisome proliferator-activated receptor gamma coactivator-related protein 1 isoform X1 n=1 Tax=Osmerus eperlanus TaxID=29151 RepID=UPI002E155990
MAARWGAGEEIISACNMEFFSTNTLDEEVDAPRDSMGDLGLDAAEALGTLQGCLDPSILSLFEDIPTGEGKCLDEESEATLLTALTEILDNVDDDNLSPFDTLPDSDLLSAQKGREHSPLRRLLCLSRSPPEKSSFCSSRQFSTGKSLPRSLPGSLQRSDGEEEEDGEAGSLTLSPASQPSSPGEEQLSWAGLSLPFPIALEEEDGLSLSLGDLVRHMHPYCMTLCVEEGKEQLLPEGGILLEVVDQGEHGEPILAIPDLCLPISLAQIHGSSEAELRVPEEAAILERPELDHVITDEAAVETASPLTLKSEVRGEKVVTRRPKEETAEKSPSRRKKKRKEKEAKVGLSEKAVAPVGGRVLRSTSARRAAHDLPKPAEERSKPEKKKKKSVSSPAVVSAPRSDQAKPRLAVSTSTLPSPPSLKVAMPPVSKPDRLPMATTPEKLPQPVRLPPAALAAPLPKSHSIDALSMTAASLKEPLPPAGPRAPRDPTTPSPSEDPPTTNPEAEPKPKPLSLQQYRLLRQQKRPVQRLEDHSTRWPSLPEAPKELCPIPCLPSPDPRDPRRPLLPQPGKNEEVEVKPAWQPMGPCAPPTPEALLAPPAYMVASSKASSATSTLVKHGSSPPTQAVPNSAPPSQPRTAPASAPSPIKAPQATPATPALPSSPNAKPLARVQTHSPTNNKPATLQNTTWSKTETLKAPAVQPAAQTHPRGGTHSQPGASAPVVPSAAPFKTTTAPPTPTAALSSHTPLSTTAAILPSCKPSATPALAPRPLARATCPLAHSPGCMPMKPGAPFKATPAQQAPPKAKGPTQELIEAFTTEIGIEAMDLTSLLEQFEETQAKEELCVPEVSGRAAAVGNSRVRPVPDRTAVERVRAEDLASTAALTPPATPPHLMWKPLAAVALLGKSRASEGPKPSSSKAIQIDARPLPSNKHRGKAPANSPAPWVDHTLACLDHDYCLPREPTSGESMSGEQGKRWNVKQQPSITIKTIELHSPTTTTTAIHPPQARPACSPSPPVGMRTPPQPPKSQPLDDRTEQALGSSVLETPDASPTRLEVEASPVESSPRKGPSGRAHRGYAAASRSPSPRERKRGRSRRRGNNRSPSPASSGSESNYSEESRSRSPPKKRYRPRHSESSSSSSSCSSSRSSASRSPPRTRRHSYSSSRSGSWSRSRSPPWGRQSRPHSPSYRPGYRHTSTENSEEVKRKKQKAIEERRVVYVGRIQGTMTRKELKERFSLYGEIEECTLHFRDHSDNYGFVTYYDTKDAFTAIENGGKLRKPNELPFDLCFGGRRQFCRTSYADLDSNREYEPLPVKGKCDALDFDTLLKQAQKSLKR